jgi:hypothetical protein
LIELVLYVAEAAARERAATPTEGLVEFSQLM